MTNTAIVSAPPQVAESAASTLFGALQFFAVTLAELVVLFVLISLAVAWLQQRLPRYRVQALLAGRSGYFTAVGLGAITPFCSCSTIPMLTGLLQARAAFGPVMAFLFTSPLLNPYVVALFWLLFGPTVTLVYSLTVLAVAVGAGLVLQRLRFERFVTLPETKRAIHGEPVNAGWRDVFGQSVSQLRQFLPHLVVGVGIGAVVHGYVPPELIARLGGESAWWLIPLAAVSGIVLYVRASTMIPIAASLVAKGAGIGPVMALTIGGAGASLPEMVILKRLFRWPLMVAFIVVVLGTACLTGYGLTALEWRRS